MITSSCACGGLKIQIKNVDTNTPAVDCHCRSCRQYHTAAFVPYLRVSKDQIVIQQNSTLKSFQQRMVLSTPSSVNNNTGNDAKASGIIPVPPHPPTEEEESADNTGTDTVLKRLFCSRCGTKMATQIFHTTVNETNNGNTSNLKESDEVLINMGPMVEKTISRQLAQHWKRNRLEWYRSSQGAAWPNAKPRCRGNGSGGRAPRVVGSCGCGKYRYTFPYTKPQELQHCYCRLCRQSTGSAYETWVYVERDVFRWLKTPQQQQDGDGAEPPMVRLTNHGRRHMCRTCGSVLTIVYDEDGDEVIWPAAGGFHDETLPSWSDNGGGGGNNNNDEDAISSYLNRVVHICCSYKQSWYELPQDGLPRIKYAS